MMEEKEFKCAHCQKQVASPSAIGTQFRNHCLFCLWSEHLDEKVSGDRKSNCLGLMEPIGLTFKHEGYDKYTGKPKVGELMLAHLCQSCGKISLNRLAADDKEGAILAVFEKSKSLPQNLKKRLAEEKIDLLTKEDKEEIQRQLFGAIPHPTQT